MSNSCPRCGFGEPGPLECPQCGVVFAKLNRPARPAPPAPLPLPARMGRRFTWLDATLLLALVVSLAAVWSRWVEPPASERATTASRARETAARSQAPVSGPSPVPSAQGRLPQPDPPATPSAPVGMRQEPVAPQAWAARPTMGPSTYLPPDLALSFEDRALLAPLLDVINSGSEVDESQIRQAEELHSRHPKADSVHRALEGLLEVAAQQAHKQNRPQEAVRYRMRATELWPETGILWLRVVLYLEERQAWRDAESVARRGLSACPRDPELHGALARSLMRQGRDDEAADVLRRLLALRDDHAARELLARLDKQAGSVAGLARQASSTSASASRGSRTTLSGGRCCRRWRTSTRCSPASSSSSRRGRSR